MKLSCEKIGVEILGLKEGFFKKRDLFLEG